MIAYLIRSVIKVDISHDKPDFVSSITSCTPLNIHLLLSLPVTNICLLLLVFMLKNAKLQRKHEESLLNVKSSNKWIIIRYIQHFKIIF